MAWNEYRASEILAMALMHLRTRINITRYVQFDTSGQAAAHTDTISIPIAGGLVDSAATASAAPYAAAESSDSDAKVRLTEHRRADFVISDRDASTSAMQEIVRTKTAAAADALASRLGSYLFTLGNAVPYINYIDTAAALDDVVDARINMNTRDVPVEYRALLMGPVLEGELLKDDDFNRADSAGQNMTRMSGMLGRNMGFDCVGNNNSVDVHTPGLTTSHAAMGAHTAGDTTLRVDGGTTTPRVGDIFRPSYALNTAPWYVVTSVQVNGASDWTLGIAELGTDGSGGLTENVADSSSIAAVRGAAERTLAIQKQAIVLAMRPLSMPNKSDGFTTTIMDPETGLPLRLEVTRQNKQTLYTLDWLYGATVVRPECIDVLYRTTS